MDRAQAEGYPVERCARQILRAIARDKEEILIGGRERFAVHLKRYLPLVLSRLIRRVRVT